MTYFLATFAFMLIVVVIMAVGVIFGRRAIKGSCGGTGGGECVCVEKCDKKKKRDAEAAESQKIEFNPDILKKSVD
ncbi:MAG: (Na+)-NQR maturation NqrM [Methylococcales bacterium]|nr:(Na+)-NQR maturation NqrM [Methylococcales bacterium]